MREKMRRYPGGRPFTREMSDLFYGRKDDVLELHRFVSLEPLVVLYGKSGLGKSSLINAGLIPKLEENQHNNCVQFRFKAWAGASSQSPLDNTYESLSDLKLDKSILDKILPSDNSLWNVVKSYQAGNTDDRLVMIFDQFEELFSYPSSQVHEFKEELAELLRNQIPKRYETILDVGASMNEDWLTAEEEDFLYDPLNIRILFIIRSDKMHLLDQLSDYLPTVLKNNYELKALSESGARAAIIEPAGLVSEKFISPVFAYDDKAEKEILSFLKDDENGMVEAIQLQILCTSFEDGVISNGWKLIDEDKVGDLNSIIENYYNNKLNTIEDLSTRSMASKLMEDGLVDVAREQRLTLHESQIEDLFKVDQKLLDQLVDIHLLRRELDHGGGFNYELSHDTLVAPVLSAREVRQKIEAEEELKRQQELLAKERKKRIRARRFTIGAILLALFSFWTSYETVQAWSSNRKLLRNQRMLTAQADSISRVALANEQKAIKEKEKSDSLLIIADEAKRTAESEKRNAIEANERMEGELARSRRLEIDLLKGQSVNNIQSYLEQEGARFFKNLDFRNALTYWSNARFFDKYVDSTIDEDAINKYVRSVDLFNKDEYSPIEQDVMNKYVRLVFGIDKKIELAKLALKIEMAFQDGDFNIKESEYEELLKISNIFRPEIDRYIETLRADIDLSIKAVNQGIYDTDNKTLVIQSEENINRFSIPKNYNYPEDLRGITIRIDNAESLLLNNLPEDIKVLALENNKFITNLPSQITELYKLEELSLNDLEIIELPESIVKLYSLQKLKLRSLKNLKTFPPQINKLKRLKELSLNDLEITELPEGIGELKSLETLELIDLPQIKGLPSSIQELKDLKNLSVIRLQRLRSIQVVWKTEQLESLALESLNEILILPLNSVGKLQGLKNLSLNGLDKIRSIPENMWGLDSLKILELKNLKNLERLPSSIWELNELKELSLSGLDIMILPKNIWEMENLERLELSNLKGLPSSIVKLKRLKELTLSGFDLSLSLLLRKGIDIDSFPIDTNERFDSQYQELVNRIDSLEKEMVERIGSIPGELNPLDPFLLESESLRKLNLENIKGIETIQFSKEILKGIKELSLKDLEIGRPLEYLGEMKNLDKLELVNLELGFRSFINIRNSLKDIKELKYLIIRNCKMDKSREEELKKLLPKTEILIYK
ncbi:MAG: hypothetical protein HKN68_16260 [Saprospiraceae bacterium]|nr:hypothetical protein [Saprospiraceae bacterium]